MRKHKKIELTELHDFDKVVGSISLVMVFKKDATVNVLQKEEDVTKILSQMLHRSPDGEYPFIAINLGPVAYGKVKRVSDASSDSPSSSESR